MFVDLNKVLHMMGNQPFPLLGHVWDDSNTQQNPPLLLPGLNLELSIMSDLGGVKWGKRCLNPTNTDSHSLLSSVLQSGCSLTILNTLSL